MSKYTKVFKVKLLFEYFLGETRGQAAISKNITFLKAH